MVKFLSGLIIGVFVTALLISSMTAAAQRGAPAQDERNQTLLYDQRALEGLQRAGKKLQIMFWNKGAQFVSLGQPRWVISGKVTPHIAGDATGAEYYYFDQITGQKEGPFKPTAQ
jgi:hypothetical protein